MPPSDPTTVNDDLTRANNLTLGASYGADPGPDGGLSLSVDANQAKSGAQPYCANYRNDVSPGADCYVGMAVPVLTGVSSFGGWLGLLNIGAGLNGYQWTIETGPQTVSITRKTSGVDAATVASASHTPQAGDIFIFERIDDDFTVWRNRGGTWSSILTGSDSAHTGAGRVGWWMYDPGGSNGRLDDLRWGTITGGITHALGLAATAEDAQAITRRKIVHL